MEPITTTTVLVAWWAWVWNKILWPTAEIIWWDLKNLYEKWRDKIFEKAEKKTPNINDGKQSNLRVTREVFMNWSFTDEEICAEYFGGILASSRSEDWKDDAWVFYVDIIKSMSSAQLKLHYIIYRTLNKEFISNINKQTINPWQESELQSEMLFIPLKLIENIKQDLWSVLHWLAALKLIWSFQTWEHDIWEWKFLPYLRISPTTLGIQLYAVASNKFEQWREFSYTDFWDFENIDTPTYYAQSIDELTNRTWIKTNS